MTGPSGRVIRPPMEDFSTGRLFRPISALIYKKWLKFIIAAFILWGVFLFSFYGPPIITIIILEFIPFDLWFVEVDWITASQAYWIFTIIWLLPALVWTYFYVKSITYSVRGWDGEVMPDLYQQKGIITVVKKHVMFRTITNVQTQAGPFDRLFGIGSVKIETAGESGAGVQPTGLTTLILSALLNTASEENIEGIIFYRELEEFILRELRRFDRKPPIQTMSKKRRTSGKIFTTESLEAFIEIRDALKREKEV